MRERREGGAELRKAFTQAANRAHCVLSERPHQILHSKKQGTDITGLLRGMFESRAKNRIESQEDSDTEGIKQ